MFMTNDTAYAGRREIFWRICEWIYDCKVVEHIVEKLDLLRASYDLGDIFSVFVLRLTYVYNNYIFK